MTEMPDTIFSQNRNQESFAVLGPASSPSKSELPFTKLWDDQNSVSFSKHEYSLSNTQKTVHMLKTDRSKQQQKRMAATNTVNFHVSNN